VMSETPEIRLKAAIEYLKKAERALADACSLLACRGGDPTLAERVMELEAMTDSTRRLVELLLGSLERD